MRSASTWWAVSGVAGFLTAAAAIAGPALPPVVIHSTLEGDPSHAVPGRPGEVFRNFWRPAISPNGRFWAMRSNTEFFDSGSLLLTGIGVNTQALLGQHDPAPWAPGEVISTIDQQMGYNNAGQLAFSSNTNDGPNETDEYVLRLTSGVYEIIAREGDAIAAVPGATYGVILDDTHILASGHVAYRNINALGLPSDEDTLLLTDSGMTLVAREGITIPFGQVLGAMEPWDAFEFQGYYHNADGSSYMAVGDLEGDSNTDGIVVIDDVARIAEGSLVQPLPNPVASGFNGIREGQMVANGDWYVRGGNSGGQDWVTKNRVVVAATGDPFITGASENWDDSVPNTAGFFINTGNALGDFLIGGYTDAADDDANAVLAINGTTELLREGDGIDLDGDGMANDDLFVADFDLDSAVLTDDGRIFVVVKVRDSAGALDEEAILYFDTTPCLGDLNGDGQVGSDDLAAIIGQWGSTALPLDLDGSGAVGSGDLALLIGNWGPCP